MIDKAHILAEIKRTAALSDGKPLGADRFQAETGVTAADWNKHWARWSDALKEAGFAPNSFAKLVFDDDALHRLLAQLARELGRFPAESDLYLKGHKDPTFPSVKPFRRLGVRAKRVEGLLRFCQSHEGFDDVAAICASAIREPDHKAVAEAAGSGTPSTAGFVYLLRSGRNYKIGRSNHAGRRERELQIQLPEKANIVHTIATDDAPGIEAYWHRRFESKRLNGEWFSLNAQDVAAFRKRKFM